MRKRRCSWLAKLHIGEMWVHNDKRCQRVTSQASPLDCAGAHAPAHPGRAHVSGAAAVPRAAGRPPAGHDRDSLHVQQEERLGVLALAAPCDQRERLHATPEQGPRAMLVQLKRGIGGAQLRPSYSPPPRTRVRAGLQHAHEADDGHDIAGGAAVDQVFPQLHLQRARHAPLVARVRARQLLRGRPARVGGRPRARLA